LSTNKQYSLLFRVTQLFCTNVHGISPDLTLSPDLQICISRSTDLYCYTVSHSHSQWEPHTYIREIRNRELRARNARHPKSSVQEPTISSIYSLYSTYTLSQHPHYKINNYSRSIEEDRTRSSGGVQHRSLHDVDMAPESLIDLPRVRSPYGSLMQPSCSPASPSTMAGDAPHTH
jgi:hypothetical protein